MSADPNLVVLDHPLVQERLAVLRDAATPTPLFRQRLREIARLMGWVLLDDLPTVAATVTTPLGPAPARRLAGPAPAIVPVLRAGLGMADGLLDLLPAAVAGPTVAVRDEAPHGPSGSLSRLPPAAGRRFLVVDPMLATGGSILHALAELARHGVAAAEIRLLVLVAVPAGIAAVRRHHPALRIVTAAVDSHLNEHAFIVPGLGDAGDRQFGTC